MSKICAASLFQCLALLAAGNPHGTRLLAFVPSHDGKGLKVLRPCWKTSPQGALWSSLHAGADILKLALWVAILPLSLTTPVSLPAPCPILFLSSISFSPAFPLPADLYSHTWANSALQMVTANRRRLGRHGAGMVGQVRGQSSWRNRESHGETKKGSLKSDIA